MVTSSQSPINRLVHETSPYLLLHADNPVAWHPWDKIALDEAVAKDKPILLSIGYSACHWCHVMERESFSDPATAALMNAHFINIKVDCEERPDLDHVYQRAAQFLSVQGGWPLTVFLTPDQRPFYAGTYFPPEERHGRPAFPRLLDTLARTFARDRNQIERIAGQIVGALRRSDARRGDRRIVPATGDDLFDKAAEWLMHHFDEEHGGFGSRPKFANAPVVLWLLRRAVRTGDDEMLERIRFTLHQMAAGGVYDQLGGGFHRYAVDERWSVPHFEKMLSDNALLAIVYGEAFDRTRDPRYGDVVRDTLTYIEREMAAPDGGFYSAQDADVDGEEGAFYVWRPGDVAAAVGERDAAFACDVFGVTEKGNVDGGATVLRRAMVDEEIAAQYGMDLASVEASTARIREKMFAAREHRVKPMTDDKAIAAWNALTVSAFARAARWLQEPAYRDTALAGVDFIRRRLIDGARLRRSFRKRAGGPGFLRDYVYWVQALIDVYEASADRRWLDEASVWMDRTIELFWDGDDPGFYLTPEDCEPLIVRPKDWRDSDLPSGTAVAALNLLRLHRLDDQKGYGPKAEKLLDHCRPLMDQDPWGAVGLLIAADIAADDRGGEGKKGSVSGEGETIEQPFSDGD